MSRRAPRRGRRLEEEMPHRERWFVSYADFITLMFAFFVVMYATSTVNEGKYRILSDSLSSAFRHAGPTARLEPVAMMPAPPVLRPPARPRPAPAAAPTPPPRAAPPSEEKLRDLAATISEALQPLVQAGQVRLTRSVRGLVVEINASVLFDPAQAVVQPGSVTALKALAATLARVDNAIEVEGHSDTLPIATPLYPSNWELSSARAGAVVRLLVESGVAPERLAAIGLAATRPVDGNDTPEGRARNRRVSLLIRPDAPSPVAFETGATDR